MPLTPVRFDTNAQQGSPSLQLKALKAKKRQAEARLVKSKKELKDAFQTVRLDARDLNDINARILELESTQ